MIIFGSTGSNNFEGEKAKVDEDTKNNGQCAFVDPDNAKVDKSEGKDNNDNDDKKVTK